MMFSYLVLIQVILTLLFQIGVLQKCYLMFSSKQRRSNSTKTFLLFFGYLTVVSTTAIIYCFYILILWRPYEILNNEQTLYLIGLIPWILLISNPVFQFGLCLERCFIVGFPYRYLEKWKRSMCIFVFIFSLVVLCFNLWFNGFIWLPNEAVIHQCRYFSCVVSLLPQKYITTYKIIISVFEFGSAMGLFCLIKSKTNISESRGKSKNRVTLIIIATTVFFEFLPTIIDQIFLNSTNMSLVNSIGPYRTMLSSLNIFISALLYTHVFNKPKSTTSTIHLFTTSTK